MKTKRTEGKSKVKMTSENSWTIECDCGTITDYSTNAGGSGLWENGKQIKGTCDFYFTGTRKSIEAKIRRLEKLNFFCCPAYKTECLENFSLVD